MADTAIEEREEHMIAPTGGLPFLRKAHFLKPTSATTSMEGPTLKLPTLTPQPTRPSLKVSFDCWKDPMSNWKTWTQTMHSKYSSVWKSAGINEAVLCSIHKISRDYDLIFGLAERWCCETNTFFFPWGEATVTLEDMMVLGGYSVLGNDPVSLRLEAREMVEASDCLERTRRLLVRQNNASHSKWLNVFMGTGSEFEHEAFLSLWLLKFVFPGKHSNKIDNLVFPMAVHLAKGRRLALAPAILVSLYRDLGLLRGAMDGLGGDEGEALCVHVRSPVGLVQVWAWERIPPLRPKPNFIGSGMVRVARWDDSKKAKVENVRSVIDSAGVTFLWRPYALAVDDWSFPGFYREKDHVLLGCDGLSIELESFVRCLRACQLVGMDCQEPYNPHRVAMQFGYDQDIPGWIGRENTSPEIAWHNYSKCWSDNATLYLPARLSEPDVTVRYLEWWRRTVLCPLNATEGMAKGRRHPREPLKSPQDWQQAVSCPNFPSKRLGKQKGKLTAEALPKLIQLKTEHDPEVPPGFEPRCDEVLAYPEPDGVSSPPDGVGLLTGKQPLTKPDKDVSDNQVVVTRQEMQSTVNVEVDSLAREVAQVRSIMGLEQSHESHTVEGLKHDRPSFTLAALSDLEARVLRLERGLAYLKN